MMTTPWQPVPDVVRAPGGAQEVVSLGDGPAILFVHGDLFAHWFLPVAADPALDGFRRVIVRRAQPVEVGEAPADMSDHAEAFVAMLDALDLADAHVCGHSFGALVALQLAAGPHRHRVRSLVLLEPAPAGVLVEPDEGAAGRKHLGPAMAAAAAGDLEAAYDGFVTAVARPDHRELTVRAIGAGALEESVRRARSLLVMGVAAGRWDQVLDETAIRQPVLLLAGGSSRRTAEYAPPTVARLARLLPRARVVELPECTHLMTLEHPGAVARHIAAFVRPVRGAQPNAKYRSQT